MAGRFKDEGNATMPHRAFGSRSRHARRVLHRAWPLVALLGLAAVALAPALGAGYWAEDIYYSAMIPANPILHDSTWPAETLDQIQHSMRVGRFYPITPLITAVAFILFRNVVAYKAYIVAVTLLDVALFYALVRRLTGRKGFALLAGVVLVGLFQFRLTVEPILGYYGQIQWVTAAFLLALIWLRRSLDGGRGAWLALSAGAYFLCTLTYEMTYTLAAIPAFLIYRARPGWRAGLAMAAPFVAGAGFSSGMTVLIRRLHPSDNYVHNTDLNPVRALGSFACQVSAGFPLSYYLADPLRLFGRGRDLASWADWLLQPGVIAVGGIGLVVTFRTLRKARRSTADLGPVDDGTLVGLGLLLATCPAILTAISPFHRNYLSPGVGWIGVMVQYQGVALLLALGAWRAIQARWLGGPFARRKCLAVAIVLAGVLGITQRANVEVVAALNAPPGSPRYRQFAGDHGAAWHLHRMNLIAALQAGVMRDVPRGSRVQIAHPYPLWHDAVYGQFFYTKQTGKRIETLPSLLTTRLPAEAPVFRVRDVLRDRRTGFVVVTPVSGRPSATFPAGDPTTGRVFVRHPAFRGERTPPRTMLLVGQAAPGSGPGGSPAIPATSKVCRLGRDLPAIHVGRGWALYSLDPRALGVDPDSLRLVDDPIQVAAWLAPGDRAEVATEADPDRPLRR